MVQDDNSSSKASEIYNNPYFNKVGAVSANLFKKLSKRDSLKSKIIFWLSLIILVPILLFLIYYIFIGPINRLFGLPDTRSLADDSSAVSSIQVYDKNNEFVCILQSKEDRQLITLEQVATPVKQALLTSEDRSFYSHMGINPMGILRATWINITSGKIKQGASTITQQLVKNIYFKPDEWRTITRKLKEVPLALEIERRYTKEEILTFYLNRIYWGKNAFGIERAAQKYFNKSAKELNVAESAYLVSLLSSPSTAHLTPKAFQIQNSIINDMEKFGYITPEQRDEALGYKLVFESAPNNMEKYPHYMSLVLNELQEKFSPDELNKGLKVYTSLDTEAQEEAIRQLNKGIKNAPNGIRQGALVTLDVKSGELRAVVGGVGDFWKNQWNRASSKHTLGSAFKPFVYLTAFMKGAFSSESIVMDTPFVYVQRDIGQVWEPKNFDKKFRGPMKVKDALRLSRNIPAIRVAKKTGIHNIIETAKKVNITGIDPYLASALGSSAVSPIDVAGAYGTFARQGVYIKPVLIRKVLDRKEKTVYQHNPAPKKVLPEKPIYELISILQQVVKAGTGRAAYFEGRDIAGKTGTADDSKDIWFAGFTPDTVTILWGGNDNNKKASKYATGGGVLGPVWKKYMQKYYQLNPMPYAQFPKPGAHVKLRIDPISGLKATSKTFNAVYRNFVPGTEPKKYAKDPTDAEIQKYLKKKEEELEVLWLKEQEKNSLNTTFNPYVRSTGTRAVQANNNTQNRPVYPQQQRQTPQVNTQPQLSQQQQPTRRNIYKQPIRRRIPAYQENRPSVRNTGDSNYWQRPVSPKN